jgi:mRNA interferase MazF
MVMKQFDVYQVNLDPTIGAEIKKSRPAVILSPNAMNKHLETVIVAPLTHSVKGYPSRVISHFKNQAGEIVLDQLRAVDKLRLSKKLGTVDAGTSSDILKVLQTMFQ